MISKPVAARIARCRVRHRRGGRRLHGRPAEPSVRRGQPGGVPSTRQSRADKAEQAVAETEAVVRSAAGCRDRQPDVRPRRERRPAARPIVRLQAQEGRVNRRGAQDAAASARAGGTTASIRAAIRAGASSVRRQRTRARSLPPRRHAGTGPTDRTGCHRHTAGARPARRSSKWSSRHHLSSDCTCRRRSPARRRDVEDRVEARVTRDVMADGRVAIPRARASSATSRSSSAAAR